MRGGKVRIEQLSMLNEIVLQSYISSNHGQFLMINIYCWVLVLKQKALSPVTRPSQ